MKRFRIILIAFFLISSSTPIVSQVVYNTRLDSLRQEHVNLRFGMFIHFNMNTFNPGWGEPRVDPKTFAPTKVDCGQWARAAVSAKMKYAILTTKHHDGFALWPSKQNPPNGLPHYTVMESSYPHDIVRMFVDSMRAYGIKPCLYFSGWDAASGIPGAYADPSAVREQWSKCSTFVLGQIKELLGGTYGEIPFFTFDGYSWDMGQWAFPIERIRGLVKQLQPNCLILDHNGACPWEVDIEYFEEPLGIQAPNGNTIASCQGQTISGDWFWDGSAADINRLKSVNDILNHLTRLEPLYCNFVLNCPPNKTGVMDDAIVQRLREVGNAWNPSNSRAPMPSQPPQIERPFTPVSATASSNSNTAVNAIDATNDYTRGHAQSLWISSGNLPQSITLDLGVVRDSIDMLMYQPRRFGNTEGNITSYNIYVSSNGTNFTQITTGTSSNGTWGKWAGDSTIKWAQFKPQSARFVKLEATVVTSGNSAVINTVAIGAELPYSLPVGVNKNVSRTTTQPTYSGFKKVTGRAMYKKQISGGANTISVYDITGKLVNKKNDVSERVYIVKQY
jgi:alpha-L-fucosidase